MLVISPGFYGDIHLIADLPTPSVVVKGSHCDFVLVYDVGLAVKDLLVHFVDT